MSQAATRECQRKILRKRSRLHCFRAMRSPRPVMDLARGSIRNSAPGSTDGFLPPSAIWTPSIGASPGPWELPHLTVDFVSTDTTLHGVQGLECAPVNPRETGVLWVGDDKQPRVLVRPPSGGLCLSWPPPHPTLNVTPTGQLLGLPSHSTRNRHHNAAIWTSKAAVSSSEYRWHGSIAGSDGRGLSARPLFSADSSTR